MRFTIVASKKDLAGMNIINELRKLNPELDIYLTDRELIYSDNLDKELKCDFIIFASKHKSIKHLKTLSIHSIGNWSKAEFGGKDNIICKSNPQILKHFFQTLEKNAKVISNYQVTMEVTHHGPFIEIPSLFIEVGSSKEEWQDIKACNIIAKTINDSINSFDYKQIKTALAIGGPHYSPNFNKIQLGEEYAIGHIIPKYALPLKEYMVKEMISKSTEKIDYAILDWKGIGNSKERLNIVKILEKFNLKVIRI
jgi:D-aminoacyl-tRNA deacylase